MATPKPRSGRSTSLCDYGDNIRLTESEKIEGTGSWETLEWAKIEPAPRSVPEGLLGFLLEAEQVIVEVCIYTRTLQECYHYSIIIVRNWNEIELGVCSYDQGEARKAMEKSKIPKINDATSALQPHFG
ncbi:hypothetical protein RHMOL_Rhmol08G0146300 [Rhododendron molle]|uniref:Uncharacterized protein n=1 Tax=Rhododendron molle TaxID=49168 RepID=A0ACC0MNB4_RHOML|nr:hypothetical protein RHMOL_Rhmol08G0146300 [Rhododendron molle]